MFQNIASQENIQIIIWGSLSLCIDGSIIRSLRVKARFSE